MNQPGAWLWQRMAYGSTEGKAKWERYCRMRVAVSRGRMDYKVCWTGSRGLGPWLGDHVKYFYSQDHGLSQWCPSTFVSPQGVIYNCAEQWMMEQKALMFNDTKKARQIMATDKPGVQKRLGKRVSNFSEAEWEAKCRDLVYFGNLLKFSQNANLRYELLSTDGAILAEAAEHDSVWGIGMSEVDAVGMAEAQGVDYVWTGRNMLGEALMRVRAELLLWELCDVCCANNTEYGDYCNVCGATNICFYDYGSLVDVGEGGYVSGRNSGGDGGGGGHGRGGGGRGQRYA
jgi:ribA/ribD-fused uncharacterized protein